IKNLPRIRATEIPGKVDVEPLVGTDPTLGVSTDGLYHLQRGGVYRINGQVFFFMGGGTSIDKLRRIEGVSWWPEELPCTMELRFAVDNVNRYFAENPKARIDVVVTHTVPRTLRFAEEFIDTMFAGPWEREAARNDDYKGKEEKSLQMALDAVLDLIANAQKEVTWFFGHWHKDKDIEYKYKKCQVHFKARYNSAPTLLEGGSHGTGEES
ncbi:MAG: hypothetical protein LC650_04505, partial [Actinobacteria bacterium]|nr:hypothetical protein [Actinomycetota bacterium]